MNRSIFLSLILVIIFLSLQAAHSEDGIYGEDDRVQIENVSDAKIKEMSRATAAMIPLSDLSASGFDLDRIKIKTKAYGESYGLCSQERFYDLPMAALCTGFLVSDQLLVTAGHCIQNVTDCAEQSWVFDFNVETLTQKTEHSVPSKNIYSCKKIVRQVLERGAWFNEGEMDYAVIELDRKVSGRKPLHVRRTGSVLSGTPLVTIGHPSGLPTIITNGVVRDTSAIEYFKTNLDTYGGNSGSPVINAQTGLVEGILVRGGDDYQYDSKDRCVVNVRNSETGGPGESVTKISVISDLLPKSTLERRFRNRSRR
jgi:V8-like Glu-specific endopeptidase